MYDFLIIGQGIAGSLLAFRLIKAGKKVFIIDDSTPNLFSKSTQKITNSDRNNLLLKHSDYLYPKLKKLLGKNFRPKVIGGLITPVTGKRFSKTWLADKLLPYSDHFYKNLEKELQTSFYKPMPIVRIFADVKQANDWDVRNADPSYENLAYKDYKFDNEHIHYPNGYTVFKDGAVIDGAKMLSEFHTYFKESAVIKNIEFSAGDLKISGNKVEWENITARKIIFCEGWKAIDNPFFKWLPFMPAKGELLIIKSEELNLKELINRGIFIRPLNNNIYLVGSTYTWDDLSLTPTRQARDEICTKLKTLIKTDFKIIEHLAGIRPTVKGRRPFIGQHHEHKNMYIFNGLGTKGLLLSPYFTRHFSEYLLQNKPLLADIDIKRFL